MIPTASQAPITASDHGISIRARIPVAIGETSSTRSSIGSTDQKSANPVATPPSMRERERRRPANQRGRVGAA